MSTRLFGEAPFDIETERAASQLPFGGERVDDFPASFSRSTIRYIDSIAPIIVKLGFETFVRHDADPTPQEPDESSPSTNA